MVPIKEIIMTQTCNHEFHPEPFWEDATLETIYSKIVSGMNYLVLEFICDKSLKKAIDVIEINNSLRLKYLIIPTLLNKSIEELKKGPKFDTDYLIGRRCQIKQECFNGDMYITNYRAIKVN